jgi:hypothetical protein
VDPVGMSPREPMDTQIPKLATRHTPITTRIKQFAPQAHGPLPTRRGFTASPSLLLSRAFYAG